VFAIVWLLTMGLTGAAIEHVYKMALGGKLSEIVINMSTQDCLGRITASYYSF
jgi:hypothetical protein